LDLSLVSGFHQIKEQQDGKLKTHFGILNFKFKKAFNFYVFGEWSRAEESFLDILKAFPDDGPSKFLLKFIGENKIGATQLSPDYWMGYRKIDEL